MTLSHFEVICEALRKHAGGSWFTVAAEDVERALRDAGYIIVRRGAIGKAQREAVAAYREDRKAARQPIVDLHRPPGSPGSPSMPYNA